MYPTQIETTFKQALSSNQSPRKIRNRLHITETEYEIYQAYLNDTSNPSESKPAKLRRLRKAKIKELLNSPEELSSLDIIRRLHITSPTYYRYKKELQEEQSSEPSLLDDITAPSRKKTQRVIK